VAVSYSALIAKAVAEANKRTDRSGKKYTLDLKRIDEFLPY